MGNANSNPPLCPTCVDVAACPFHICMQWIPYRTPNWSQSHSNISCLESMGRSHGSSTHCRIEIVRASALRWAKCRGANPTFTDRSCPRMAMVRTQRDLQLMRMHLRGPTEMSMLPLTLQISNARRKSTPTNRS